MNINYNRKFVNKLKNSGYDEVSTFLVYPNADEKNVFGKGSLSSVEMSKDYVNSDDFLKAINLDSGIVFVGLNYAQRKEEPNDKDEEPNGENEGYNGKDFQTMHDCGPQSNDNRIAASLIDIHGANSCGAAIRTVENSDSLDQSEAYGSFAFDIINKYSCTNLGEFVGDLVNRLNKETPEVNITDKFDMKAVKERDSKNIANKCRDSKHNSKHLHKCPSCKVKILDILFDRLVKYDIPSFINLMNWVKPKGVICFGDDSEKLVSAINDIYHLNLNVQGAIHYSHKCSYYDKRNSVHQAVENIIK